MLEQALKDQGLPFEQVEELPNDNIVKKPAKKIERKPRKEKYDPKKAL